MEIHLYKTDITFNVKRVMVVTDHADKKPLASAYVEWKKGQADRATLLGDMRKSGWR